jgi:hypothetical protein
MWRVAFQVLGKGAGSEAEGCLKGHRRKVLQSEAQCNAANTNVSCPLTDSERCGKVERLALACTELDLGALTRPGVYILLSRGEVVYVGQSINVLARIGQHAGRFRFDRALFIALRRKDSRLTTEAALIRRFDPRHCAAGPKNGVHRDAAVLRRLGLCPDADTTARFVARQDARWTDSMRKSVSVNSTEWHRKRRDAVHKTNLRTTRSQRSVSAHATVKRNSNATRNTELPK